MQRQTLESALAPITAQYKAELAEAKANANPRAEAPLSFHDRERIKMSNDESNRLHQGAVLLGNRRMTDFINSAMNPKDKDHFTNFKILKEVYNMDQSRVKADFIAQAEEEMDAHPYEKFDPAYESNILRKYKPTGNKLVDKKDIRKGYKEEKGVTPFDMQVYNIFTDAMKAKWREKGYRGDAAYIQNLVDTYDLEPNEMDMSLREVKAKS